MVQDNDGIIELTDEVTGESSKEEDEGIIELTEVVPADIEFPEAEDTLPPLILDSDAGDDEHGDEPVIAGESSGEETRGQILPEVSREVLDAALERVIEKKFSETIEKILFEVMEKVIQKEITDIKASLQKDLDDIGRP